MKPSSSVAMFYKYFILPSAWRELCLGESGSRCLPLPDIYFGSMFYFPVSRDMVLKPFFVFTVFWGYQARSKSCRSDGKTCTDTVGFGPGSVSLFLWVRKGQMLCFAMWLLDEKYCFSSLSSFKFQSAIPTVISHFYRKTKNLQSLYLCLYAFKANTEIWSF